MQLFARLLGMVSHTLFPKPVVENTPSMAQFGKAAVQENIWFDQTGKDKTWAMRQDLESGLKNHVSIENDFVLTNN